MPLYDPLGDCQSDAAARIFLLAMQALKDYEYPFGILGIDPNPVIPDGKEVFIAFLSGGYMNTGCFTATKLYGVINKVLKESFYLGAICYYSRHRVVCDHGAALFNRDLQVFGCKLDDMRTIGRIKPLPPLWTPLSIPAGH